MTNQAQGHKVDCPTDDVQPDRSGGRDTTHETHSETRKTSAGPGKAATSIDTRPSENSSDDRAACPECDSICVVPRNPGHTNSRLPAEADSYRCRNCTATFDEPATTTLSVDVVEACPVCDDTDINDRQYPPSAAARYRCTACGATFPEPARRRAKRPGGNFSAAYKALAEADPDDLVADGGQR